MRDVSDVNNYYFYGSVALCWNSVHFLSFFILYIVESVWVWDQHFETCVKFPL
jgi:hypothetical protein